MFSAKIKRFGVFERILMQRRQKSEALFYGDCDAKYKRGSIRIQSGRAEQRRDE